MKKYLMTILCAFVAMTTNAAEDITFGITPCLKPDITPGHVVDSVVLSQELNNGED